LSEVNSINSNYVHSGRIKAQVLSSRLLTAAPGFNAKLIYLGFVADEVAIGQVFFLGYLTRPFQCPEHIDLDGGMIDE
jgi:hypothetical protein